MRMDGMGIRRCGLRLFRAMGMRMFFEDVLCCTRWGRGDHWTGTVGDLSKSTLLWIRGKLEPLSSAGHVGWMGFSRGVGCGWLLLEELTDQVMTVSLLEE